MKTINRFSALQFRNGKFLKNRVVVPPMASETADLEGGVTDTTVRHYRELAGSGAALVIVEYTYVAPSGRSELQQLGIYRDEQISGLRRISDAIHDSGALSGIQLTHAGGKTSRDLTGGKLMGPSGTAVPAKDSDMESPDPMSVDDITEWQSSFLSAVGRAEEAGFDLVEFHAAHGYGLNQWLSPLTNQRTDDYGGTLKKNARLLFEILEAARKLHPKLLFAVRMPGQDFIEGGLTSEDAIRLAREFETLGVDLIDVSSGIGGWRRPKDRPGEGYLVSEAAAIQAKVSLPVIGVGGIEKGSFIDEAVSSCRISLAAVGRAILKQPGIWGHENLSAHLEGVSHE